MDKHTHLLGTIESLRKLGGVSSISFVDLPANERASMIGKILHHFDYAKLSREDKGVVRQFLQNSTGYSRAQIARYITAHLKTVHYYKPDSLSAMKGKWNMKMFPALTLTFLLLLSGAINSRTTGDVLNVLNAERTTGSGHTLRTTNRTVIARTGSAVLLAVHEEPEETLVTWSLNALLERVNARRIARLRLNTPHAAATGQMAARPDIGIVKEIFPPYDSTKAIHAAANDPWDVPASGVEGQVLMIQNGKPVWRDFPYLEQIRSEAPHGTESTRRAGGNRNGGSENKVEGGNTTTTIIQQTGGGAAPSGWTDDGPFVYLTDDTANVGIGVNTPETKLEVAGTISGSSLAINGSITGATLYISSSIGGAGLTDCDALTSKIMYDAVLGQFVCGVDQTVGTGLSQATGDLRYVQKQGDSMTGTLTINLASGSVGLRVMQTISGSIIHADRGLTTSGTLVFEGAASGSSLYVASSVQGAGLVDCDIAGTSKLLWDSTTGRFSCGTDTDTDTNTTYSAGRGLTLNGNIFTLNSTLTGALVRFNTISGSTIYAKSALNASGSLSVDGTAYFNASAPLKITDAGFYNCTALETDADGDIVCGSDTDTNTTYTAGQGLTLNGTVFSLNSTITGSLARFNTFSGSIITAKTSLASSGTLTWEGAGSGSSLYIASSFRGVGLVDCDIAGTSKLLWDSTTGRFSCGTDTDTDTNTTYTAARGLSLNGTAFSLNSTITGALVRFNTISGSVITAKTSLASSGSLTWEGAGSGSSLYIASSLQGVGLTDCDAASQVLKWDATSGRFSCGTATNNTFGSGNVIAIGDSKYVNVGGDTMTGTLIIHPASGLAVNARGTLSGSSLFTLSNYRGCTLKTSATGAVICSTDNNTTYYAGQGLTLSSNVFSLNSTITGALVRFTTISGSTVYAKNLLASSGTLVTESGAYFDGTTMVIQAGPNRVGIGTAAPSSTLHIVGDARIQSGNMFLGTTSKLVLGGNGTTELFATIGADAGQNDTTFRTFRDFFFETNTGNGTAGTNRLTIKATTGNVGIGTDSPDAKLEVLGTLSGSALTISSLHGCDSIDTDAQGNFVCGTDATGGSGAPEVGTASFSGAVVRLGNSQWVKKSGDTMTGGLIINPTSGLAFTARGTISGSSLLTLSNYRGCTLKTSATGAVICGTDNGTSYYAGQGLSLSSNVLTLNSTITGSLVRFNTISGSVVTAKTSLASSGSLTWEGAASGASLWVSTFEGAGLTDCDASTNKVIWDATLKRFACSTDLNTGSTYTAGRGLTLNGTIFSLNSTITGALVRFSTISGSVITAKTSLASSGTLTWEGAGSGSSLYVASSLQGAGLVDCDIAGTSKLLWDSSTGRFSCGTDTDTNTTYAAAQGLTLNGTAFSLNSTITGALVRFQTISGSTITAKNSLASSGSLTWEGAGSGSSLYIASSLQGAGLVDCDIAGTSKLLWDSTTGRFSCGTDTDTDTNTTYTAGRGLGLNGTSFSLNSTITGALVRFTTVSGSTITAKNSLASSGSLTWEGAGSGSSLYIASSFQGVGLTDCDAASQVLKWDATSGRFSCGTDTDTDTNTTYTAAQGLTLNGTAFSLNSTITGALVRFTTISGSTIFAKNSLSTSGSLIVESNMYLGTGSSLIWGDGGCTMTRNSGPPDSIVTNSCGITLGGNLVVGSNAIIMSDGRGILDTSGFALLKFRSVGGAANYWDIQNNVTGGSVILTASGSDTNVNALLKTKGDGRIDFAVNNGTMARISSAGLSVSGALVFEGAGSGASLWLSRLQVGSNISVSGSILANRDIATRGTLSGSLIYQSGSGSQNFMQGVLGLGSGAGIYTLNVYNRGTTSFLNVETNNPLSNGSVRMANPNRAWVMGVRGDLSNSFAFADSTLGLIRFMIDTSGNVGIGSLIPKAKMDVVGTISGSLLVLSNLHSCPLSVSATGAVICGSGNTPEIGTLSFSGAVVRLGNPQWVNQGGDTMTGTLVIGNSKSLQVAGTISGASLKILGTGSGNIFHAEKSLTSSGILVSESGAYIDGTTFVVQAGKNRVGIGTASPSYQLHILNTALTEGNGAFIEMFNQELVEGVHQYALAVSNTANPTQDAEGLTVAATFQAKSALGNKFNFTNGAELIGGVFGASHNGQGYYELITGEKAHVYNAGTGSVGTVIGDWLNFGSSAHVGSASGAIASAYGIWLNGMNDTSSTIGVMEGAHIRLTNNSTRAIGVGAGINILALTGSFTNKYGIYQQGSNDANYFAGRLGLGTATPNANSKLDIIGGRLRSAGYASNTGYLLTNSANLSSQTNLNPGIAFYGGDNANSLYGADLGYNSTTSRYRTRLFAGQTNTDVALGVQTVSPAVDQSSFSEKMTIRGDSGNVGIGIAAPKTKLEVLGGLSGSSLVISRNAVFAGSGVVISSTGSVVFNENSRAVDFRIEGDTNASLFYLDASADRIGIAKSDPKATLDVLGSLSGSSLTISNLHSCSLSVSATGAVICGSGGSSTPEVGTLSFSGAVVRLGNAQWVKKSGDTMTGALVISVTGGSQNTLGLRVINTASGAIFHAEKSLTTSGTLLTESGAYFDGTTMVVQAGNNRIGIGTATPTATMDILGGTLRFSSTSNGGVTDLTTGGSTGYFTIQASGNVTNNGWGIASGNNAALWTGDMNTGTAGRIYFGPGSASFSRSGASAKGVFDTANGKMAIGANTADTALEIIGTTSGSIINAKDALASSGTLVWEGAGSGASLWLSLLNVGSNINASGSILARGNITTRGTLSGALISQNGAGNNYFGGKLGIGTTTPGTTVNVAGIDPGAGTYSLGFRVENTATNAISMAIANSRGAIGSTNATALDFITSNTVRMSIGATGNVGIGNVTAPASKLSVSGAVVIGFNIGTIAADNGLALEVLGTASGSKLFASRELSSSGVLILKSLSKTSSGAATIVGAESQTGAYISGSGAAALALDTYTNTGSRTPHILFGYRGTFDTGLYRVGKSNSGALALRVANTFSNNAASAFEIYSNAGHVNNKVFRVATNGATFADGAYASTGADYAEWFMSKDKLLPGEAVCIDVTKKNSVKRCTNEADGNVMGIVSTNPSFVGNSIGGAEGIMPPGYVLVGLIGQVPAKVIVEGSSGAIRPGDSLTAASIPGYARKAKAGESTVGVALEGLTSGQGVVNVLISRRNQSLTVEAVEDKVLKTIASMEIEDEVQLMVSSALSDLNVDSQIADEVNNQISAITAQNASISSITSELNTLKLAFEELKNRPTQTGSSSLQPLASSGQWLEADAHLTASTMEIEDTLIAGGDTRIGGDLSIDGTLNASSLFVPNGLTIDGGVVMNGLLDAVTLHVSSGATIDGVLTINGTLNLGSGARLNLGSGALTINQLVVENALFVMGDITINGLATFLGDINVKGELVVSSNQAGFAMIPTTGTSVTVHFGSGFTGVPVVTASPDVPVLYAVTKSSATGFTIRLGGPAPEDVTFAWHALSTNAPVTIRAELTTNGSMLFPLASDTIPVSSNMVWNACIRNITMLDEQGQPLSCGRYHEAYNWTHPDLNITFIWNTSVSPALLQLPEGYETQVTEDAQSILDAIQGTEEEEAEQSSGTGAVEESVETGAIIPEEEPITEEQPMAEEQPVVQEEPVLEQSTPVEDPFIEEPVIEEQPVIETPVVETPVQDEAPVEQSAAE